MSGILENCGPCGNVLCSVYGCIKQRLKLEWPEALHWYTIPSSPVGCICPPTSEQTCQNPVCPRKPREGKHD